MSKRPSFANLRDDPPAQSPALIEPAPATVAPQATGQGGKQPMAPSRVGKKAITGYFTPEMSFALHSTARRHGMSLQALMAEAFNDVLRKYGESPVGE